jgi:TMEM175 potassium channel family protein
MMTETKEFISKGRLDALTDGVFAFAMTLLVVNLDLPQDFHPSSAAELISALLDLGGTLVAYVVTFLVLASFWLGRARTKEEPESASGAYAWSLLFHLFFVTLLPFSMIVAGRYQLAPAIWVYGANMIFLAVTAIGITFVIERDIQRRLVPSGRLEFGVLIASAILSMAIGFYSPDSAMYAYFINLASPLIGRWEERVEPRS